MVVGAAVAKKAATAGPEAGKAVGGQAEAATDGANQSTTNSGDRGGNGGSGGSPASQVPPHRTPPPNAPSGPKPPSGSAPPAGGKE